MPKHDEPVQPPHPLPKLKASPIPQIPVAAAVDLPPSPSQPPRDEDYTDGIFTADGEDWALAIKPDDERGRTHFAKNSLHFWNGTAEEFKAKFDKK